MTGSAKEETPRPATAAPPARCADCRRRGPTLPSDLDGRALCQDCWDYEGGGY